jgi:hypothetical protein
MTDEMNTLLPILGEYRVAPTSTDGPWTLDTSFSDLCFALLDIQSSFDIIFSFEEVASIVSFADLHNLVRSKLYPETYTDAPTLRSASWQRADYEQRVALSEEESDDD